MFGRGRHQIHRRDRPGPGTVTPRGDAFAHDMISQMIILAGGKGTRLATVVGDAPKPLVPIGGKPLLAHHLGLAEFAGLHSVKIFAGYRAEQVKDFVARFRSKALSIEVLVEDEPLGTAGAVTEKLDRLDEHFFVVYGDTMLNVDLGRMAAEHLRRGADITLLTHPNDHPHDSDLIEANPEGWVTRIHRYPHPKDGFLGNLVNRALYVIRRDALKRWAGTRTKQDFAKDVFPRLLEDGKRILAYRSKEYIKDMGTPERLEAVERDWRRGRIPLPGTVRLERAIFLDRDGTLNRENGFIRSPEQMDLIPGVAAALRTLREADFRLVVLTNQPVIARGEASEADLARIHSKLEWLLGLEGAYLDRIYHCPHHPDRGFADERVELKIRCACRKPATGLVDRACAELGLDPTRSWMIGDSTGDIAMAARSGLRSVLLQTGQAGKDGKYPEARPDFSVPDLSAAARQILLTLNGATTTARP